MLMYTCIFPSVCTCIYSCHGTAGMRMANCRSVYMGREKWQWLLILRLSGYRHKYNVHVHVHISVVLDWLVWGSISVCRGLQLPTPSSGGGGREGGRRSVEQSWRAVCYEKKHVCTCVMLGPITQSLNHASDVPIQTCNSYHHKYLSSIYV